MKLLLDAWVGIRIVSISLDALFKYFARYEILGLVFSAFGDLKHSIN